MHNNHVHVVTATTPDDSVMNLLLSECNILTLSSLAVSTDNTGSGLFKLLLSFSRELYVIKLWSKNQSANQSEHVADFLTVTTENPLSMIITELAPNSGNRSEYSE